MKPSITQCVQLKQMLLSKPQLVLASCKKAGISSVKELDVFWEIQQENPALAQIIVSLAVKYNLY